MAENAKGYSNKLVMEGFTPEGERIFHGEMNWYGMNNDQLDYVQQDIVRRLADAAAGWTEARQKGGK